MRMPIAAYALAAGTFAVLAYSFWAHRTGNYRKTSVEVRGVLFSADVADTDFSRMLGLSGRSGLGDREGMLFLFEKAALHGFWMKDMRFPIDIIWIQGGRVIGVEENVAPEPGKSPWSLRVYYPPAVVETVLEVPAGTVGRHGIGVGDAVSFPGEISAL